MDKNQCKCNKKGRINTDGLSFLSKYFSKLSGNHLFVVRPSWARLSKNGGMVGGMKKMLCSALSLGTILSLHTPLLISYLERKIL